MSSSSDTLEANILDHLFRTASWTKPAALYLALFTVAPDDAGAGGTEVSGGSYARVNKAPSDANWNRSGSVVSNAADVFFPAPTADWAEGVTKIVAFGVYSAITGGTYLGGNVLTSQKNVLSGDAAPKFPAGTLTWTAA